MDPNCLLFSVEMTAAPESVHPLFGHTEQVRIRAWMWTPDSDLAENEALYAAGALRLKAPIRILETKSWPEPHPGRIALKAIAARALAIYVEPVGGGWDENLGGGTSTTVGRG